MMTRELLDAIKWGKVCLYIAGPFQIKIHGIGENNTTDEARGMDKYGATELSILSNAHSRLQPPPPPAPPLPPNLNQQN